MRPPTIRIYSLELKCPWAIASRMGPGGRGISQRATCLLKLEDEHGRCGYGEAAPVTTYGETLLSVLKFLRQVDYGKLSFDALPASLAYLHSLSPNDRAARAALDTALHDGAAKASNTTVSTLLHLPSNTQSLPPTSYSIGIGSPDAVSAQARAALQFPIIKLKAGPQDLAATLQTFRSVSPRKPIRIDGNETWQTREQALAAIKLIANYGPVECVEQPMPRHATLEDLAWLKRHSPLPLLADESCLGIEDLPRCAEGFHGVNVKLAKSGGIAPARQLLLAAQELGLKTQLGCMIESSLGIAAALALAPLADWLDLDGALLTGNDPFFGVVESSGQLHFHSDSPPNGLRVAPVKNLWHCPPPGEKPIAHRAQVPPADCAYGYSANGLPLEVHLPQTGQCDILIFAAIHGEEPETTTLLSKALRSLDAPSPRCAVVLCANPDGTLLGTRGNANGVELNRNFPTRNWQSTPVSTKWAPNHGRVDYSTGSHPGCEPETQSLVSLVQTLAPKTIISLHAPLACIEDPEYSPLGYWLSKHTDLPLVGNIGYETPGSFGSWAKENGWHVITYELPPYSISALHENHLHHLIEILKKGHSITSSKHLNTTQISQV